MEELLKQCFIEVAAKCGVLSNDPEVRVWQMLREYDFDTVNQMVAAKLLEKGVQPPPQS